MSKFNLVSSKQLIAELFTDFNITGTDWVNKAQRHINRAIELMQISGYFEFKTSFDLVEDGKVIMPCDNKYLIGVLVKSNGNVCRLPLTTELTFDEKLNGLIYHQYDKGYVNNNYLYTTFNEGEVCFLYFGIPTDDCGDLMIPDNAELFEAIPYYIIYRLSFSGYKHPAIEPRDAYQMWQTLYPRAANSMNYPSIEEMQHFTEVNTNPLYIDVLRCGDVDFKTLADRFQRKYDTAVGGSLLNGGNGNTIINNTTVINKTVLEGGGEPVQSSEGWILLNNPAYTISSTYTGEQDIAFQFPITNNVLNDTNATQTLKNLVNVDGSINLIDINSSYTATLTFKIKSSVPSREGNIVFKLIDNVGNTSDVAFGTGQFLTDDSAGVEKAISIALPFYMLDTIVNYNRFYLETTIEANFEIYDIQLYIENTYNG